MLSPTLPDAEQYEAALRDLLPRVSETQLLMLRAHYWAPARTITAEELALAAGKRTYRAANSIYGRLGVLLRAALGPAGDVGGQRSHILASFRRPDAEHPYWRWVMHPPLRRALTRLRWFPADVSGDAPGESGAVAALEGAVSRRLVLHRCREQSLRHAKLQAARGAHPAGRLVCEVPGCGFDFEARYGALGAGFAEVHHRLPLAELDAPRTTTLADLAVVCANCHRMIHRGGECRPVELLLA